ncbi:hypothetical protein HY025_04345 [Candidatus Daviesbacteria bacterium]|nr:hypothetical protein [Candidatus Daviesbacteria bacterium]
MFSGLFILIIILSKLANKQYVVHYGVNGFSPEILSISKNDVVIFQSDKLDFWPASDLHPTHLIYPQFDPKKPIESGQSWSFRFGKIGKWRYHNHLAPNFTGVINVTDGKSINDSQMTQDIAECEKYTDISQRQKCWDDLLQLTVINQGLDPAFDLFVKLYQVDPSIPKACHGWAHILGRTAYSLFKAKKNFVLRKETSYCGYGFFHGFIEKLLQDTKDLKATRDFCVFASKQLKDEAPGVYGNCLHGIGHGAINIDDSRLWGNFQAMLETGLKTCDSALTDSSELLQCYDGSFNAMQQNAYHKDYKLDIDRNDLFKYCRGQKEQYLDSCFYEFTGLITDVTKHNFKKAAEMIIKEAGDKKFIGRTIMKLSADFFQDDIANKDYTQNVLNCRALPNNLQKPCFNGIMIGFIAHGEPEKQYIKGLEFCKLSMLTSNEKDGCYRMILGQTVKRGSPVCNAVEEKYRQYCNG